MTREKNADGYATVRIPVELADEIDEIVKSGLLGYKTRSELVKECCAFLPSQTFSPHSNQPFPFFALKFNPTNQPNFTGCMLCKKILVGRLYTGFRQYRYGSEVLRM